MPDKLYLFRIKLRGHPLHCHATDPSHALHILSEQTGEPLEEYGLEWDEVKNLDGSSLTDAETALVWGYSEDA